MAKMFEIKGKTATQNAFLAFAAYNRAKALADEQKVKIDFIDGKKIVATAKSNKAIVAYVDAFESEYAKAHKAYAKAKGNAQKPSEPKWKADLKALAGKGTKANKDAAAILRKHGLKPLIGEEGWDYWASIR